MVTDAPRSLRRVEITLWVIGLSLLGVALGATVHRWSYQAEQERALVQSGAAMELAPRTAAPLPQPTEPAIRAADEISSAGIVAAALDVPAQKPKAEPKPVTKPLISETLDPDTLGRIEIPRLGLRAIVREGEDESTLERAVGWLPGTARPGEGGNTALAGHRDTFFRSLRKVRVDDRIRFFVPPHTYEYRVASVRVVEPDEVSVLESTGTEELTLITCHPFRLIGPAPDRFIVKATRIP